MKKFIFPVLYIIVITVIIPYIIIYITHKNKIPENEEYINVYIAAEDKVEKMNLSQYLKEVTAAEMPADFPEEALKAQAVAARTYLKAKIESGKKMPEHKGADICTDYKHCNAWLREADRKNLWDDEKKEEYWGKISKAVEETSGEIIMYDNKPIDAVFHSTSSGYTEKSADVWGKDVPYLQNVESEGDALSPKFTSEFSCTEDEFKSTASKCIEGISWDNGLFSDIVRSDSGGIITIQIGDKKIKGTEFRTMFNLNSTNAELECENGIVNIHIKGCGHGVGMSQYGAKYCAENGMKYNDILTKYYTGVKITN